MRPLGLALLALMSCPTLSLAATDPAKGEAVFEDRCSMCHQLQGMSQGPTLKGVVGRPAASVPDFSYTDALKKAHLIWTTQNLGAFLKGPSDLVPGTAMMMTVPDPSERADLIAFLTTQK